VSALLQLCNFLAIYFRHMNKYHIQYRIGILLKRLIFS
jgi:hypothetical protein